MSNNVIAVVSGENDILYKYMTYTLVGDLHYILIMIDRKAAGGRVEREWNYAVDPFRMRVQRRVRCIEVSLIILTCK
jgi:hypothetical protein